MLTKHTGLQLDPEVLCARRWRRKLELVAAQPLLPGIASPTEGKRSGLSSVSRQVPRASGWQATSTGWASPDFFDAIVTGDDVARVKPDPELYLLALARLGLAGH